MKKLIAILLCFSGLLTYAQINPSYQQFNTNRFQTNATPWKIDLRDPLLITNLTVVNNAFFGNIVNVSNNLTVLSNINVAVSVFISNSLHVASNIFVSNNIVVLGTNFGKFIGDGSGITNLPANTWIPNLAYELWYDPMVSINSACIGSLCWLNGSGGGGAIAASNAPAHFGTIAISSNTSSNTQASVFLSSTATDKPVLPRLDQETGWTNRTVWRLNGTNDCKMYIVLSSGLITALQMTNAIGIAHITATNNQIMGYTATSSGNLSFTNLGVIQSQTWYTNEVWSTSAGTICFNLNGGPIATLNTTVPTTALTPRMGVYKTAATAAVSLEVDVWQMVKAR